jgi:hypothetical protein
MKPFNLEEALAGKPVVTRSGDPVTQIVKFDLKNNIKRLVGYTASILRVIDAMAPRSSGAYSELLKYSIFSNSLEYGYSRLLSTRVFCDVLSR